MFSYLFHLLYFFTRKTIIKLLLMGVTRNYLLKYNNSKMSNHKVIKLMPVINFITDYF